jgi:hypothetical protein
MSSSDRVAQLYLQAQGSLFVAIYDLQGYGGGIPARLHTASHTYIKHVKSQFYLYYEYLHV